jgi:hypothetical protein
MFMNWKFSELVESIRAATIPAWFAEHIFANKTGIALTLQKSGEYSFKSPAGQTITITYEADGNV